MKPFEMIDDVGIRSARHFVQRRFDDGEEVRKDVGAGGEEDGDVDMVEVDCAELRRRRKEILGRR